MKLGNIFATNTFRITQSPHGKSQGFRALDCTSGTKSMAIIAPCDVKVGARRVDGAGNPYFEMFNNNFKIQVVHASLEAKPYGTYRKGTYLGHYIVPNDPYPDHAHAAVQVNGIWYSPPSVLDPKKVKLTLSPAMKEKKWGLYSTYPSIELNILPLISTPELPKPPEPNPKVVEYTNVKKIIIQL